MKTCFFIGHRDAPAGIQQSLEQAVEYLIQQCEVTGFIVGCYGEFDRMATAAVQKAKRNNPCIYARRLIPYHPSVRSILLPEFFDDYLYPEGLEHVPKRFAITRANRLMLEKIVW